MAEDKEKKAFWKGYADSNAVIKDPPGFVDTLFGNGGWKPPSGQRDPYKAGWDSAQKDHKKNKK